MKKVVTFASLLVVLLLGATSCSERHLISDEEFRQQMEQDLEKKMKDFSQGDLFAVLQRADLSLEEKEALQFLYAYMPLSDLTDYEGSFHLMNVQASLRAREEMPWGKQVPELFFRHFVLPERTNREALDSSRVVFYEELKDRVKHLSMADAILEVNHWCHEKVIYTPSDSRTSSPLATVRTAYGRCGEESVLLVAALRSVGIPARQVYTPRWAHTDDNHAWVEAWAGDGWHFLGACEPEPVLDLGWFNAPAGRGMLMYAKVFGRYAGTEEVMLRTSTYTEINVTDHYAPTASVDVDVVDADGNKAVDAKVEFKLYNYAEFYTVATKKADAEGHCRLTAGKGDMLVWASKEGRYGYAKVSFGKDTKVKVTLSNTPETALLEEWDMVPPVEQVTLPEVTEEQRAENNRRMAYEDSLRTAYTSTFFTTEKAQEFARQFGVEEERVARMLVASRGNHATLTTFLKEQQSDEDKQVAVDILSHISSKDLRDVRLDILRDHQKHSAPGLDDKVYNNYIRNPRISDEELSTYKSFFEPIFTEEEKSLYASEPMQLAARMTEEINVVADCNLGGGPLSPMGVWKAKAADAHSRDICFVAVARSLNIPARIDEVTGKVQLVTPQGLFDVNFGESEPQVSPKGMLKADYQPTKLNSNPKYYSHFSISKITPEGRLQLLNYSEGDADLGEGTNWRNLLKEGTRLDVGNYVLVTGTRLASGSVLTRMDQFTINEGTVTRKPLVIRQSDTEVQVIGNFNSESLFTTWNNGAAGEHKSLLQACGRGYFVVGVIGVAQEPTNHALRDIAALQSDLEKWGRTMVLLFPDEEAASRFKASEFPGLPSTVVYGIDTDGIAEQAIRSMKLNPRGGLPIFLIADTFNRVVFVSQGYTIGLGEQLMKTVHGLN